jgi:glucose/mannose transport system substrate-binding protein
MMNRWLGPAAFALGGLLFGCGKPADTGGQQTVLNYASYWSAPGEAEALSALLSVSHTRHPNVRLVNTYPSDQDFDEYINKSIADGHPPDAFQVDAYALETYGVSNLEPLGDLFKSEGWDKSLVPEALAAVSRDGVPMAVPVGMHRENGLFYNTRIFKLLGLAAPTSIANMKHACEVIKGDSRTAGVAPLAVAYGPRPSGTKGGIVRQMFQGIAAMSMGREKFLSYFVERKPTYQAELNQALADFDYLFHNCINADANSSPTFDWDAAATKLVDGAKPATAAMNIQGDWVKGLFTTMGFTDYDVVAMGEGLFLFDLDAMAVSKGAADHINAMDFMSTWGSLDGQAAFNQQKGSTTPRSDLDPKLLKNDEVSKHILADMVAAKTRSGVPDWLAGLKPKFHDWSMGTLTTDELKAALIAGQTQ